MIQTQEGIANRISKATSRLMAVSIERDRARVTVPVVYPSGSSCVVEIVINGDKCFVSDLGLGRLETEMQGADEFYDYAARRSSEYFHVKYDGFSVFAIWASLDKLETAITAVSNASAQAVSAAIQKSLEERQKSKNAELFERTKRIFGEQFVARKADVAGRDAKWEVNNFVQLKNGKQAVFEFVSESQNAIANKFMMFSDLVKGETNISLNSVVLNISRMGKKGAMLSDVSNMVEMAANDDEFARLARVA